MSKVITLRKGLDIKLQGCAENRIAEAKPSRRYALSPIEFEGVTPKLLVKAGDEVKAGDPLFFNKYDDRILFTSPVSGTVTEIVRGEKRRVLHVVVEAAATQQYRPFTVPDPAEATREQIVELLLQSGLWPMLVQRPYGVLANPDATPKAIFVSAFDSAPLAPDYEFVLADRQADLQKGIEVLGRLTGGKVHLSVRAGRESRFAQLGGVELHTFAGKHPAGNVGVQIHQIDPIDKGDIVWTINLQDLAIVGRLFNEGRVDMTRTVAVTGSEVKEPGYCRVVAGAEIASLLEGNVAEQKAGESVRIICGNVLTGAKTAADGFVGWGTNQVTVIPEGDRYELLGWAMPRFGKFSVSRAYFSWLFPGKRYRLDTNLNGGERPYVVTGLFDKYLPMDIFPMYLLKACLAGDIDKMEALGIYEVLPEDLALCEFVDPSKTDIQQIVRDAMNLMIKEA